MNEYIHVVAISTCIIYGKLMSYTTSEIIHLFSTIFYYIEMLLIEVRDMHLANNNPFNWLIISGFPQSLQKSEMNIDLFIDLSFWMNVNSLN